MRKTVLSLRTFLPIGIIASFKSKLRTAVIIILSNSDFLKIIKQPYKACYKTNRLNAKSINLFDIQRLVSLEKINSSFCHVDDDMLRSSS